MSDCMMFPNDWAKFLENYSFVDKEEVYTNGSRLVPVFRVEQMVEHYFQNRWIPVTERLPEEDGKFLAHKNLWGTSYISTVRFAKDARKVDRYDFRRNWKNVWYEYDSETGYYATDTVTHWMPLPEPPKED